MGHRQWSNKFPMFETGQDQNRNHITAGHPFIHMGRATAPENGPSFHPMENMLTSGVHYTSLWDSDSRPNDYSSGFSMEAPHVQAAVSGSSYNPLPCLPAAGGFYPALENNAGHAHSSYYNRHTFDEVEGGLLDPTMGTGRGPFKRKSPGISVACERGITSRFYGAGSSSGSSAFQLENPTSEYQFYPSGPIGLPHYTGGIPSIAGEDPLRNVRSRPRLDLEPNPRRTQLSSYSSHHYHSTTHLINHPSTVDLSSLNADAATHERNHVSVSPPAARGRFLTSETSGLNHETNQFLQGRSTVEIGGHHHDSISSRNPVSPSQYLHGLPQAAREGHTNYSRRAIPAYRTDLSYPNLGLEAASSENGLQFLSETYSSRYSRSLSVGGWRNNYRNGRSRIAIERFQSLPNAVDPHDRMGSEALLMVDRPSLHDSRTLFDQYREMRLDIDDMGYEDLLALGERIGNVNTGLSEYMISKCLMEKKFCSSDQNQEEAMCAICLEGYNKKDKVARMKNCGHDYHVDCIKKWLSMKNACPICKAYAISDGLN